MLLFGFDIMSFFESTRSILIATVPHYLSQGSVGPSFKNQNRPASPTRTHGGLIDWRTGIGLNLTEVQEKESLIVVGKTNNFLKQFGITNLYLLQCFFLGLWVSMYNVQSMSMKVQELFRIVQTLYHFEFNLNMNIDLQKKS